MPTISANISEAVSRKTPPEQLPQLLTEAEVAAYLSLTEKQVVRMRYDKLGPQTIRVAGKARVQRDELIAWIGRKVPGQTCK